MSIYYQSIDTGEFFFTTDISQHIRQGQKIPDHFVPLTLKGWSDERVKKYLENFGDKEIKNPDPKFQPKEGESKCSMSTYLNQLS